MTKFYIVTAYENYETIYGIKEERQTFFMEYKDISTAAAKARQLFLKGDYSGIYVSFSHGSASAYYNPGVGISPTGSNWIDFFENEVL